MTNLDFASKLKHLENWLNSWQRQDGAYNGLISTFWESSNATIEANAVHQAPIINGYINLYQKTGNPTFLNKAVQAADFLVRDIHPEAFYYRSLFGDVPGKVAGPILNIECDLALLRLHRVFLSQKKEDVIYLQTVLNNVTGCLIPRWWDGKAWRNQVANQIAKGGELFLELYDVTQQQEYLKYANGMGEWLLEFQIQRGDFRGAFEQSHTDSRIITVYQAPCLPFLVAMHKQTGNSKYQQAYESLTAFIARQELPTGGFVGYYEQGFLLKLINYIMRRVPLFKNYLYQFKRALICSPISKVLLTKRIHPIFIARLAEIMLNLSHISNPETFKRDQHLSFILSHQLPSGGICNCIGDIPTASEAFWVQTIPPLRWNAFIFEWMTSLLPQNSNYPSTITDVIPYYSMVPGYGAIVENQKYFGLLKKHSDGWELVGLYTKYATTTANWAHETKKKNLLIVTPIFPPDTGGCASRMSNLVRMPDPDQWNVYVISDQTNMPSQSQPASFYIKRIPLFVSYRQLGRLFATIYHLIHQIKIHQIDVVLATIPPGLHAFVTLFIVKLIRRKFIIDIRDPWISGEVYGGGMIPGTLKYLIGRWIEKILATKADAISSVYQGLIQEMVQNYHIDPARAHWIPNGFNSDVLSPSLLQNFGQEILHLPRSSTIFLYQGLIATPQNVVRFLDFIPNILDQIPNAHFVFVGGGEDKGRLVGEVDRRALKSVVSIYDKMERSKIIKVIQQIDYGIVTLDDKFGYAIPSKIFEYLSWHKPLIGVVPLEGEMDRLLSRHGVGINLLREAFRSLLPITTDNPIYQDLSWASNAGRFNQLLDTLA